jgi:hypothetical protein
MNSYSQIGQDLLVLKYLKNKTNGTYVDIGCGCPTFINNTFLLEKDYGWTGVSIDLIDYIDPIESPNYGQSWSSIRPNSVRILHDALTLDYCTLFKEKKLPKVIDFLTLDLEPPSISFECLFKIPFDKYEFNFIAFETDEYREGGPERRDKSREYITSLGYIFVESVNRQDDFYINGKLI